VQKLKSWFSYAKTKDKSRKVEPFRAWLTNISVVKGAPRRVQLPWVLWQDDQHGEVLRTRYRDVYKKDADEEEDNVEGMDAFEKEDDELAGEEESPTCAQLLHRKFHLAHTYFGELSEEEQQNVRDKRENDYAERREAYDRRLKGETDCTPEELAEYVFCTYSCRRKLTDVFLPDADTTLRSSRNGRWMAFVRRYSARGFSCWGRSWTAMKTRSSCPCKQPS
jgi:hypothetical protein